MSAGDPFNRPERFMTGVVFPRLSRRMRLRFWWRRWRNGECRHGVERRDGAWCADCEGMEPF